MPRPRRPPSPPRARRPALTATGADAARVAASIRDGRFVDESVFDRFLPPDLRRVSDDYWTPLPVVRRVASWLRRERVKTLVDIGSGAGKFCVATALLTSCRVTGLEARPSLVAAAQALAARFEVDDRVRFVPGAFGDVPTPAADAYYLFNPFGEYAFDALVDADDGVVFSEQQYIRDVDSTVRFLARAPVGTCVITYNGFGGDLPATYEQERVDLAFRGALRLWKKRAPSTRARTSFRLRLPSIEPPGDD